jgi:hypothetical protein
MGEGIIKALSILKKKSQKKFAGSEIMRNFADPIIIKS